eukprot:scaffold64302_cov17-Tisochrysis_lutea.AAC.2
MPAQMCLFSCACAIMPQHAVQKHWRGHLALSCPLSWHRSVPKCTDHARACTAILHYSSQPLHPPPERPSPNTAAKHRPCFLPRFASKGALVHSGRCAGWARELVNFLAVTTFSTLQILQNDVQKTSVTPPRGSRYPP